MPQRNVLSRDDRRDFHEVERFALFHGAAWLAVIAAVCLVAGVISLAVWRPWAAGKEARIHNQVVVHSPQFVGATNARLADLIAQAQAGGPQTASVAQQATAAAGEINWDEVRPGNQAALCQLRIAPANATC